MEPATTSKDSNVSVVDPILEKLKGEPHRVYTPEALARLFNPKLVKDAEKLAVATQEVKTHLDECVASGELREINTGIYKARLFFDPHQMIEHAFTGGMDNTHYRFSSTVFRLNIGVLSLFFMRNPKKGDWIITVRDSTIGKDYCVPRRLFDGTYIIGCQWPEVNDEHFIRIEGRYIEKKHLTINLSGELVKIEDHKTLDGTRIDHLTPKGMARYEELGREFLKKFSGNSQMDPVNRGRFVLEHFVRHHENLETTFFGTVVNSLLV